MRAREEAAKAGELPHEFLVRISRGETIGDHAPSFQERMDAAKAAAPYFAPKFSAVTVDAHLSGSHKRAQEMTDQELDAIIRGGAVE